MANNGLDTSKAYEIPNFVDQVGKGAIGSSQTADQLNSNGLWGTYSNTPTANSSSISSASTPQKYQQGLSAFMDDLFTTGGDLTTNQNIANANFDNFSTKWGVDDSFNFDSLTPEQQTNFNTELMDLNADTANNVGTSGDFLSGLGGYLGTAQTGLQLLTGLDSLFGSGKDAKEAALKNLEQSMDINEEKMDWLRSDRQDFKDNQQKVTSSYFA